MTDLTIANTIAQQLGGLKPLTFMTGAKDFVGGERSLQFRLPIIQRTMRITLTDTDDYTIELFVIRGTSTRLAGKRTGIYCEQLQEVFRSMTGLENRTVRLVSNTKLPHI